MSDEEHDLWEALAVGHAMRALEPADDALFRGHLATCERCARVLVDCERLVGALAFAAEPVEPPPALRERIVAISRDTGARVAPVVPAEALAERRTRRNGRVVRWAAAAAVVSAIASSGITYAAVHGSSGGRGAPPEAVACLTDPSCVRLPLVTPSKQTVGAVLVRNGTVFLATPDLPRNSSHDMYVLWRGDAAGKMTAIASFRLLGNGSFSTIGAAPDMTGVVAMAISRETLANQLPPAPSAAIAIASVPSTI
ncbi:MAG: hypothetical protein QOF57_574 [Frankiaceae bacterium]|jgi:hypothetical protein|nr:hypothetical protein [Frankiaceae bacterium]